MHIAALACSNGLGHVRRVIAITSFILKNGFQGKITIFLPLSHLSTLRGWKECKYFVNHPSVRIIDFHYPPKGKKKTQSLFDKDWKFIDLPDLMQYDRVWSDNITQVLEVRKDTILSGSFFWHEVFANSKGNDGFESFITNQRDIVLKVKPLMVGNEYFATPEVVKYTSFHPVGLYRYDTNLKEKTTSDILISCGLGGEEEDVAREAVEKIIKDRIRPPAMLWVEPRLLPLDYPEWVVRADFSAEMFHRCLAVCIRPGLGTVSDALVNRTRIFSFFRRDAYEMKHNAEVINRLQVGENCENPFQAYLSAVDYVHRKDQVELQNYRTSHLRTDGVFATAQVILRQHTIVQDQRGA